MLKNKTTNGRYVLFELAVFCFALFCGIVSSDIYFAKICMLFAGWFLFSTLVDARRWCDGE